MARLLLAAAMPLALAGVLPRCKASDAAVETPATAPKSAVESARPRSLSAGKPTIQLIVTVDWEGADMREENLRAMEVLRARFPQVKLVHFLNAAYYTRGGADPKLIDASIRRVIRPGDEYGLHLHGWKRLVEAAGVVFRPGPRFTKLTPIPPEECPDDCGIDVPISVYTSDELRKVVKLSIDLLASHGYGRAKSFRCGGWMLRDSVREAIAAEGITHDHSDVATSFLAYKIQSVVLWDWLTGLWPSTTDVSQPYMMKTSTTALVEVPDNGALAGYTNAAQMVDVFQHNKQAFLRDPSRNVVVSFGFHQELSKRDLPDLTSGLEKIFEIVKAENLPLEIVTNEAIRVDPPDAVSRR